MRNGHSHACVFPLGTKWSLAAPAMFLFILPFAHTVALRLVCLGLTALTAFAMALRAGWPRPWVLWPLAFWVTLAFSSVGWSVDPDLSLKEAKSEAGYTTVAFLSFLVLSQSAAAWEWFRRALFVGLGTMTVYSLFSVWRYGEWVKEGWVSSVGYASSYLALMFAFILALVPRTRDPWGRVGLAVLSVLLMAAGYFTLSRAFWLSLAATMAAFALLVGRQVSRREAFLRLGVLAAAAVAVGGGLLAVIRQRHLMLGQSDRVADLITSDIRWSIWGHTLERIAERPWTGYGFGRGVLAEEFRAGFEPIATHTHNLFLDMGLGLGVPGTLLLLAILATLVAGYWQLHRSGEPQAREMGLLGLLLLVALLTRNATDNLFARDPALLFWSLAGIALGRGMSAGSPPSASGAASGV
jgi:O-antigen ligase